MRPYKTTSSMDGALGTRLAAPWRFPQGEDWQGLVRPVQLLTCRLAATGTFLACFETPHFVLHPTIAPPIQQPSYYFVCTRPFLGRNPPAESVKSTVNQHQRTRQSLPSSANA